MFIRCLILGLVDLSLEKGFLILSEFIWVKEEAACQAKTRLLRRYPIKMDLYQ